MVRKRKEEIKRRVRSFLMWMDDDASITRDAFTAALFATVMLFVAWMLVR